jgi:hypothetical protein
MRQSGKTNRRRLRKSGALLLLVCGSISACFYPPVTTSLAPGGTAPKASSAFVHKVHEEVLKQEKFQCTDCHLYDLAYMARDKAINQEISRALTRAGTESCHFCHIKHPKQVKVSLKCLDCHADIRPLRPENHRANWISSHSPKVAQNELACANCHSSRFCVKCHMRRDEADRSFHTGVAIVSHPIEARADPVRCQRCHQLSWCTRCHKSGRF